MTGLNITNVRDYSMFMAISSHKQVCWNTQWCDSTFQCNAGGWTICGLVSIPQVLWGEAVEPTLLGRAESHALRAFSSSSPFGRWWGGRRQNRRCKGWGQKEDNGESRTRKTWERDKELKGKAAVYRRCRKWELFECLLLIFLLFVEFVEFTRDAMSFIKTHVFFTSSKNTNSFI